MPIELQEVVKSAIPDVHLCTVTYQNIIGSLQEMDPPTSLGPATNSTTRNQMTTKGLQIPTASVNVRAVTPTVTDRAGASANPADPHMTSPEDRAADMQHRLPYPD